VGWAAAIWGAFLYWWAGIVYLLESIRVVRIPQGTQGGISDTVER
jgi:cardiolipin synthase